MADFNMNWRQPSPSDLCRRCYQPGHIASGCRVWKNWSSYQRRYIPSAKQSSSAPEPLVPLDVYQPAMVPQCLPTSISYDNITDESLERKKYVEEPEDYTLDSTSDESEDLDENLLYLEGCVTVSKEPDDYELYLQMPYDRESKTFQLTEWCYNCSDDFHSSENCPNPSDPVAVHLSCC